MGGSLGQFQMRIVAEGKLKISGSDHEFCYEKVGIYIIDSYDFNGSQPLGYWDFNNNKVTNNPIVGMGGAYTYVNNDTFRNWRTNIGKGGDFMVFSNVEVKSVSDVVKLK